MTKFVRLATCIALFAMLFSFTATAQQIETPTGDRTWEEMMADPTASFYETQAKFNAFWEGRTIEKGKGFKAFKRWEHYMAPRVTPITGEWPEPDAVWQAMQEQPEMFTTNENMPGDWTYIGNTSVPNGGGAGRVNSVRPLPGSTTTWFACSPGGGLWKTTNSGTSWSIVGTDFLSSIGVSDVAIDPGNTNIMYIATGDGDHGDTYALGVLKSTDGGATWNTTGLSWNVTQTRTCSRIIMHPSNSQLLICATSNGIWRTTDGGVNWTQELNGSYYEVTFKPGDPSIVYGVSDQFYKSTDTGNNWAVVNTGLPTSGDSQRMAMAVTSANSDYVYVLASANNSGLLGVYRSTDSGATFTTQTTTPNLLGWNPNGADSGGQGWYDLCIAVDPTDANIVYTGGVNIWKSIDGGSNFALNGHWYGGGGVPYVHADNHYLGFIGTRLTVGNDGGVFSTTNGGPNWTDNSSNLAIAQQYKLGLATLNANLVLTGWQDNGTNLKNGAVHSEVYGGDGMECAIDATNSNIMYATLYYGSIQRSTNGGAGWSNIVGSGGANEDEDGAWVTPYVLGANQAHIFVGKSVVYKSIDSGGTFTASAAFGGPGDCNDMALAPSDNNIVFASKGGSLFKSTDNAATFAAVGAGLPGSYIKDIAVHNTDPNKIWVVVSNYSPGEKVYYSSNGGSSWTNISGTLPNLPANAIVFQNGSNNGIYVGMDAGVYYRDEDLGAWVPHMNLLPNVVITELEIHYATSTISASTFGRGLWRAPLYTLAALDAVLTQVISPTGSSCNTTITPQIEVLNAGTTTITAMNIQYQVVGQAVQNYAWTGTLASTTSATITMPTLNYGAGAFTINFSITSVNGGVDDNTANNAGTNNYITISGTNTATLTLITDCYPSETSWQITDGSANVIHSGSGYPSSTTNTIPLCLPNDCFTFTIFDSYGDGLNGLPFGCPFNGDYTITDNATSTVLVDMTAPGGAFGFSASHNFCFPLSSVPGCTNSAACNYNAAATIDDGTCVLVANDLCAGAITIPTFGVPVAVSTVGTCQDGPNPNCGGTQIKDVWYKFTYAGGTVAITTAGGTLTDTRLAVYSSCGGAQIACDDDDGAGNYSLINFGCTTGNGAAGANEATLLVQGQTYYIQAGGFNNITGTFNLTVTVTNVIGCTNVTACNYNPCANVNSGCVLPSTWYLNADGDNYYVSTQTSCTSPGAGYVNAAPSGGAGDCNDANAAINPGATELLCDGIDNNCNSVIDEGRVNGCTNVSACNYNAAATCDNGSCTFAITWYLNADGDNYYASTQSACTSPGAGYTSSLPSGGAGDCNDANAAINPGATELLCDGIDNNCNSVIDEGRINGCTNVSACNYNPAATCDNGTCTFAITWYLNADGDNYYASTQSACTSPGAGYTSSLPSGGAGDCNDANAAINPGATELLCDGIDNNCNTVIDEGRVNGCTNVSACNYNAAATCDNGTCTFAITWYLNADGDNYYASTQSACTSPGAGYTSTLPSGGAGDCNDANAAINPGATEVCNGVDDDCDASIDEGFDIDNDGFTTCEGDCNDNNNNIFPGAPEACNGIDDDCDSVIDDNVTTQNYYTDTDGDGFGSNLIGNFCLPPANSSLNNTDCDDNNAAINPNATEVCNGIDDDCDSVIDDNVITQNYYNDMDGDGFGAGLIGNFCSPPSNSSLTNDDCNDNNAAVRPGATEVCNGIDDDCDGSIDDNVVTQNYYNDVDGDGFGAGLIGNFCLPPANSSLTNNDCNDNNAAIHPGATDVCNGIDDDCDGSTDEDGGVSWWLNADGDNYAAATQVSCTSPGAGWTTTAPQFNGDCNDNNASIHPGATELCANGIDENCNGFIDEGCGGGGGFDNMAGAVSVSSNNNIYPSCNVLNGTCAGATISAEGNPLNVVTGEDVWYKFTAVSPGVRVIVNTSAFDAVIELHNNLGAELNAENLTGMAGSEILNYAGLTEGAQYFVAIRNYNSALGNGAFTVCIQALMDSRCDEGSGTYALCSNFKPDWTGASNYVFNFTPSLGGATTSASYAGQIPLSTPALALQYGVAYINTVDAVYYLSNGTGNLETIVVVGNETCNVQIGTHANEQVKVQQRCPAILFKSGILQAKPFVCGGIQHEFEFTQVDMFNVPIGLPFSKLTTGASSTLGLWFTTPQALIAGARYSVRVKPIFNYGPGTFGTPQCIEISSASMTLDPNEMMTSSQDVRAEMELEVVLYPNPTSGEMVQLNIMSMTDGFAAVSIMDGMGRIIYSTNYVVEGNLNTIINFTTPLANGLYTVEVMLNGEHTTQRLMVQK